MNKITQQLNENTIYYSLNFNEYNLTFKVNKVENILETHIYKNKQIYKIYKYNCANPKDFEGILPKFMVWYNTTQFTNEIFEFLPRYMPYPSKLKQLY